MGCFDTLHFVCPACGCATSEQSKADDCRMCDYDLSDAPLTIIADIHKDGKEGRLFCERCSKQLELTVRFVASPRAVDAPEEEEFRTV